MSISILFSQCSVFLENSSQMQSFQSVKTQEKRAFSRLVCSLFEGLHSTGFNLPLNVFIYQHEELVLRVTDIMRQLSYQIPAAELRHLTNLRVKLNNKTRWVYTYHMLQRYIDIKYYIPQLVLPESSDVRLTSSQLNDIKDLCEKFAELDSVTVKLQYRPTTLLDERTQFGVVMKMNTSTRPCFGQGSQILKNPIFEFAIIKCKI